MSGPLSDKERRVIDYDRIVKQLSMCSHTMFSAANDTIHYTSVPTVELIKEDTTYMERFRHDVNNARTAAAAAATATATSQPTNSSLGISQ
jgi:hypothetical protein